MKTFSVRLGEFLLILRKWLNLTVIQQKKEKEYEEIEYEEEIEEVNIPHLPLTEQAELLQLCCKIFGKAETVIRKELKNFPFLKMERVRENIIPRRIYKGFTIEYKEYTIYLDLSSFPYNERKKKPRLYCYNLWIFYQGERVKQEFIKALENEDEYSSLWEDCYIDLETNTIKISLGEDPFQPELPYYIAFSLFGFNP